MHRRPPVPDVERHVHADVPRVLPEDQGRLETLIRVRVVVIAGQINLRPPSGPGHRDSGFARLHTCVHPQDLGTGLQTAHDECVERCELPGGFRDGRGDRDVGGERDAESVIKDHKCDLGVVVRIDLRQLPVGELHLGGEHIVDRRESLVLQVLHVVEVCGDLCDVVIGELLQLPGSEERPICRFDVEDEIGPVLGVVLARCIDVPCRKVLGCIQPETCEKRLLDADLEVVVIEYRLREDE